MKTPKQAMYKLHEYFDCYTDGKDYNESLIIKIGTDRHDQPQFGLVLPQTPEWCEGCNGTGGRSQWDINGYDIDSMLEDDDDGYWREAYFSGKTDVACNHCGGSGTTTVIDYDGLTDEQHTILQIESLAFKEEAEDRAMQEAERRMGC